MERIVSALEPFSFDRVYGAFWDMVIEQPINAENPLHDDEK